MIYMILWLFLQNEIILVLLATHIPHTSFSQYNAKQGKAKLSTEMIIQFRKTIKYLIQVLYTFWSWQLAHLKIRQSLSMKMSYNSLYSIFNVYLSLLAILALGCSEFRKLYFTDSIWVYFLVLRISMVSIIVKSIECRTLNTE